MCVFLVCFLTSSSYSRCVFEYSVFLRSDVCGVRGHVRVLLVRFCSPPVAHLYLGVYRGV